MNRNGLLKFTTKQWRRAVSVTNPFKGVWKPYETPQAYRDILRLIDQFCEAMNEAIDGSPQSPVFISRVEGTIGNDHQQFRVELNHKTMPSCVNTSDTWFVINVSFDGKNIVMNGGYISGVFELEGVLMTIGKQRNESGQLAQLREFNQRKPSGLPYGSVQGKESGGINGIEQFSKAFIAAAQRDAARIEQMLLDAMNASKPKEWTAPDFFAMTDAMCNTPVKIDQSLVGTRWLKKSNNLEYVVETVNFFDPFIIVRSPNFTKSPVTHRDFLEKFTRV